jgi:hypothetical protein
VSRLDGRFAGHLDVRRALRGGDCTTSWRAGARVSLHWVCNRMVPQVDVQSRLLPAGTQVVGDRRTVGRTYVSFTSTFNRCPNVEALRSFRFFKSVSERRCPRGVRYLVARRLCSRDRGVPNPSPRDGIAFPMEDLWTASFSARHGQSPHNLSPLPITIDSITISSVPYRHWQKCVVQCTSLLSYPPCPRPSAALSAAGASSGCRWRPGSHALPPVVTSRAAWLLHPVRQARRCE